MQFESTQRMVIPLSLIFYIFNIVFLWAAIDNITQDRKCDWFGANNKIKASMSNIDNTLDPHLIRVQNRNTPTF